jgi:hypothetical protein
MKTSDTSEKGLESIIVTSLVEEAGYVQGDPQDYDRDHATLPARPRSEGAAVPVRPLRHPLSCLNVASDPCHDRYKIMKIAWRFTEIECQNR